MLTSQKNRINHIFMLFNQNANENVFFLCHGEMMHFYKSENGWGFLVWHFRLIPWKLKCRKKWGIELFCHVGKMRAKSGLLFFFQWLCKMQFYTCNLFNILTKELVLVLCKLMDENFPLCSSDGHFMSQLFVSSLFYWCVKRENFISLFPYSNRLCPWRWKRKILVTNSLSARSFCCKSKFSCPFY